MRRIVLGITSLLALSLTLAAIGIIGYRVVLAANSRPTPAKTSYYPSDWLVNTSAPLPSPTISIGLAWKRTGNQATVCGQLALVESTESRYATCGQSSIIAELTAVEYRQYLYYLSQYAPFAYSQSPDAGVSSIWLGFGGHGENQASQAEEAEIARWAEVVYLRLKQEEHQASIIAAVRLTLASHLGVSADEITTEYVKAVDWPNACLGLFQPGVDCARVRTAGYQVVLVTNGVRFEYRTNNFNVIRLANSATLTPTPLPATETPLPPTPYNTRTLAPSATASPTMMPSPRATASQTAIPSPTTTPRPSATSSPTATASPTATPSPTATASPTITPSPTATASPTSTPSPTITDNPTATPNPTETVTPTVTASPTAVADPTTESSATPSPAPDESPRQTSGMTWLTR